VPDKGGASVCRRERIIDELREVRSFFTIGLRRPDNVLE
jgi:hypothetical protein